MYKLSYVKIFERNTDEQILSNVPHDLIHDMYKEVCGIDLPLDTAAKVKNIREALNVQCITNKPLIGVHQPFDGLGNLWLDMRDLGTNVFQCFLRNNRNMKRREFDQWDIDRFNTLSLAAPSNTFVVHAPYAINPASGDDDKAANAERVIREDLSLISKLSGNGYYVVHPGAYTDYSKEVAMNQLCSTLTKLKDVDKGMICLETMGGQGTQLLSNIRDLEWIFELCPWIHLCVDTCHLFAAGVAFDEALVFLSKHKDAVKIIHVNDSATHFNSRVDRHANIGYGKIGKEYLLQFLDNLYVMCPKAPMILETPEDGIIESLDILQDYFRK